MRNTAYCLLIMTLAALAAATAAQDGREAPALGINFMIDAPVLCTREQATAVYETLEDFQRQINDLELVNDLDELADWFAVHNAWVEAHWAWAADDSCDGVDYLLRALHAQVRYRIMERMLAKQTGISLDQLFVDPRADAMDVAHEMAEIDLQAMEESTEADVALKLNGAVADVPRCSAERALQFYATIDGFEENVEKLLEVDSWQDWNSWAFNFHLWRIDAWGDFYEQPCGVTLMHTYNIEAQTYLAGLMIMVDIDPSDQLSDLIQQWRAYHEYDLAVIAAMSGE